METSAPSKIIMTCGENDLPDATVDKTFARFSTIVDKVVVMESTLLARRMSPVRVSFGKSTRTMIQESWHLLNVDRQTLFWNRLSHSWMSTLVSKVSGTLLAPCLPEMDCTCYLKVMHCGLPGTAVTDSLKNTGL